MPQFEYHSLPRRQLPERLFHALANLPAEQTPMRITSGTSFRSGIGSVQRSFRRRNHRGLFLANLSLAQLIQAEVRRDPVQPGMETAIETELIQISIYAQESFLV